MKAFNNYEKEAAMDFAHAMGLKRDIEPVEEVENEAMSFAMAMGLKRYTTGLGTINRSRKTGRAAVAPKFA